MSKNLSTQEIRSRIAAAGLKVTPQRMAIYEALSFLGHASVDDVCQKVQEQAPYMSPATVYTTLERFAQKNLISRLLSDGSKMMFDITARPHCHFCSEDFKTVQDWHEEDLIRVVQEHLARYPIQGFHLKDIKVNLIGDWDTQLAS